PRPPAPPLFPYTTLFRSQGAARSGGEARRAAAEAGGLAAGAATQAAERYRQCADRDVLAPQWRLDRRVLDRRSDARHFLADGRRDRKSTRLNSSHDQISY